MSILAYQDLCQVLYDTFIYDIIIERTSFKHMNTEYFTKILSSRFLIFKEQISYYIFA